MAKYCKRFSLTKKIFLVFMLSSIVWANAAAYSQDAALNLGVQKCTVSQLFKVLEKQTGYDFFYNNKHIDANRNVSVNTNGKDVFEVLDDVFAGTNVSYSLVNNRIVLSLSEAKAVKQASTQVKGVVTDVTGEAVIGASVVEKGTTNGTITDLDGNFTLNVSSGKAQLEISYIGYQTQLIKFTPGQTLKVVLKEDSKTLQEVVVVGFGSQKKANLTGAVAQVKMDEVLGSRPLTSAADALQGSVPGLMVSSGGNAAGSSKSFQIRGAYSIGAKNSSGSYGSAISPLVLIDNVEGDIDMLNPEDIETVTVLKDAASSAIYGARAAGGVILITTKRPKSETKFQLNYNNNFAFANAVNLPQQESLMNYLQAFQECNGDAFWSSTTPSVSKWMEYLTQYKKDPSSLDVQGDGVYKDAEGKVYYLNEKDLVKNMLETSFQQTHNVSMTGGTSKLRYRMSGSFVDNNGVLITDKDKFSRINASGFISADITNWFTQEATFSYAHSKKTLPSSTVGGIYSTRLVSFYPEGNMPAGTLDSASDNLPFFTPANQIAWANPSNTLNDNPRIFLKSILKPMKGFEVAFEYTFDKKDYDYSYYTGKSQYTTIQGGAMNTIDNDYLTKTKRYTNYNAINLYGTYSFNIAKEHRFKVMAGFNQESSYLEQMTATSYGQAVIEVPSLGAGTSTLTATDAYNEYSVRGGFFRVNYNYKDRYMLEANGRYDGSSKFPKNSRFGFFPSVSAGWNIAQENFMESTQSWLGSLKLRGSYGMIGNQNVPAYSFIPTMSINNKYSGWLSDANYVTAITSLPSLVSTSFTWEKVGTLDFGLDFSMFNNRFTGTFDWYQRNTKGMLAPGMQLPGVIGADAPYQNTADMRTNGWEFNIGWRDRVGEVGYRVNFNISDSQFEITKYDANESKLLSNFYTGQKLGEIWGYEFDGFFTVDDFTDTSKWTLKDDVTKINGYNNLRPGDVKFKNLRDDENFTNTITTGDNTLDNPGDRKVIGNTTPRYLYGLTLGGNFKGFDLNIFMQGTAKRDYWIASPLKFPLQGDPTFVPLYEGTNNYWRPVDAANGDYTCANPGAEFPRIYGSYANSGSNYRVSDKYLSDASYFRIKNVTLSYSFPKSMIQKFALSQLKAFVSVENLATFSSLPKGIDPETLSWNYPSFRTVSFGLNLSL